MSKSLTELYASSPLFGSNATAVERFYEQYLQNPDAVPAAWRDYFDTLGDAETEIAHSEIRGASSTPVSCNIRRQSVALCRPRRVKSRPLSHA